MVNQKEEEKKPKLLKAGKWASLQSLKELLKLSSLLPRW